MAQDGRLARKALQQLESLEGAGVTHLPKRGNRGSGSRQAQPSGIGDREKPGTARSAAADATATNAPPLTPQPSPLIAAEERPRLLEIVRDEVAGCTRCTELARTRTQTVFGVGNPSARLMFIGEAPGADEDRTGFPFVGRAGQLLTNIIGACKLTREEVFIANILKCRPPENRTPAPDEAANCIGYLERQIAIIRPEFICCLGTVAAQNLLKTDISIGRLRKQFHDYQGIQVVCTYHPSYLLRNPAAKRDVWEDMKMLMRRMGVEL